MLVEPQAARLSEALAANRRLLANTTLEIAGEPLAEIRRCARAEAGFGDAPLVVTGHQPDFIHAGVWAKHVVAVRLATAVGGQALNLVVDHDAPRSFTVAAPQVGPDGLEPRNLKYADWPAGAALEGLPASAPADIERFRGELAAALGPLAAESMLPEFWAGYAAAPAGGDWVDQSVAGRRAVEAAFDVRLCDRRVSSLFGGPLLAALLTDARRFADAYNTALAAYRLDQDVRSPQRPMPDLALTAAGCETALWIYRRGAPRQRLFVEYQQDAVRLRAGGAAVARWPLRSVARWGTLKTLLAGLDGWVIRPRALTLTLWARLLLGDLFIHGIGGAKYDRITDGLIRGYFGVEPPAMGCVSATLRLDLPGAQVAASTARQALAAARAAARDVRFNPERRGAGVDEALLARKRAAVAESQRLRREEPAARIRRREIFQEIRAVNAALLKAAPTALPAADQRVQALERASASRAVAADREYFFAMHRRRDLQRLLSNLPGVTDLRPATIV